MVPAWRLVKTRYAAAALDGKGAMLYGARWSSEGLRVVYTADSDALAVLEVIAHLKAPETLTGYSMVTLRIPKRLIVEVPESLLPARWREFPAPPEVQAIGDRWLRAGDSAALRVPSALAPSSHNFLLNPEHPDFAKIEIDPAAPFQLDPRLVKPLS